MFGDVLVSSFSECAVNALGIVANKIVLLGYQYMTVGALVFVVFQLFLASNLPLS